jgi:hypothetical protein
MDYVLQRISFSNSQTPGVEVSPFTDFEDGFMNQCPHLSCFAVLGDCNRISDLVALIRVSMLWRLFRRRRGTQKFACSGFKPTVNMSGCAEDFYSLGHCTQSTKVKHQCNVAIEGEQLLEMVNQVQKFIYIC